MNFDNRFDLMRHIGDILHQKFEGKAEDVYSELNESTGRCDIIIEFNNGDTGKLSISMTDKEGKEK